MKIKKKKYMPLIQGAIILSITVLIFSLSTSFFRYVSSKPPSTYEETVIVIDPGHGDFDTGAIAKDGTVEKDINLNIALMLRDIFIASGYRVVMTRSDDQTLAFQGPSESTSRKRSDTQNRVFLTDSFADSVMISIHQNTFSDRSQHGAQVFYGVINPESALLADAVRASIVAHLQPDNTRELKRGTDSIYILMKTEAPVILVECGFITNYEELALLKQPGYQHKMAYAIYLGYCDYLRGPQ